MIRLTSMDKREIVINANLIEMVECVPETVITFVSGKKVIVSESVEEVIAKVINYQSKIIKAKLLKEDGVSE